MNGNDKAFISYRVLWATATTIIAASFIGASTMFSWHKETPHGGSLTVERFDDRMLHFNYKITELSQQVDALRSAVERDRRP